MAGKLKAGALGHVTPHSRGCLCVLVAGMFIVAIRADEVNDREPPSDRVVASYTVKAHTATDMHKLQVQTQPG